MPVPSHGRTLVRHLLPKGDIEGVEYGRHRSQDLIIIHVGRSRSSENGFETGCLRDGHAAHVEHMHKDAQPGQGRIHGQVKAGE